MKIRSADGQEYHLNDYHFIHRYRFVKKVGTSVGTHVVLLEDFRQWNELATAAAAAPRALFKCGGYAWEKRNGEIFPTSQGQAVDLTGEEINALAAVILRDVDPSSTLKRTEFTTALRKLRRLASIPVTQELDIQLPQVLPPGVGYDRRTWNSPVRDRYIWGADGSVEYPHIHCFLEDGYITSAQATVSPAPGSQHKRGFKFQSDLTVIRKGSSADDQNVLDELERVLRAVVTGEALPTTATGKKDKPALDLPKVKAEVYDAAFVDYAATNDVPVGWVHAAATACDIKPEEIAGYPLELLVEMASQEGVVQTEYAQNKETAPEERK
ncbi:hypothetical protein [Saccharothrix sp. Mg75]|uniref:hypothetical protein n=1 Tax=Saccharothrix sp. Mg75 TaxID=3445357 RepID=UPI003EE88485